MKSERGMPPRIEKFGLFSNLFVASPGAVQLSTPSRASWRLTDAGAIDAPPVLLLHALALDHRMWARVAALLEDEARLIAPDLPGHGCDCGAAPVTNLPDAADALCELLDFMDVDRVAVAGVGFGAKLATELAANHPDRVESLCLFSLGARSAPAETPHVPAVRSDDPKTFLDASFPAIDIAANTSAVAYARRCYGSFPSGPRLAARRAAALCDVAERLEKVQVRTICVAGGEDPLTSVAAVRAVAEQAPDRELSIIPDARRLIPLSHPAASAAAIRSLLKARPPSRPYAPFQTSPVSGANA